LLLREAVKVGERGRRREPQREEIRAGVDKWSSLWRAFFKNFKNSNLKIQRELKKYRLYFISMQNLNLKILYI
jgi:hypothetical protein